MKAKLLPLILLLCTNTHASFLEFFGTSTTTTSIGNQSNADLQDAGNNYYHPALTAWAKDISLTATASLTSHDFEPITNVVTENSTTGESGTDVVYGDVNTDYADSINTVASILLPLAREAGVVSLTYTSLIGTLVETNSGHPTLPEYSLYRARYRRTGLHFNYAYALNDRWSVALGTHVGFQASARVNTQVSLGDDYGSSGNAKTQIDPSLGAILSVSHRFNKDRSLMSFTFQQEMKTNLEAVATGEISDPPLTLINVGLENMIYYDPHTLRLSYAQDFGDIEGHATVEYQMWEHYEAPIVKVTNLGGSVRASDDYENLKLRSIIIPKIGVKFKNLGPFSAMLGAFYRPTPFDSDFSAAGNTIDADVMAATAGLTYDFKLFNKKIQLGLSGQYHHLIEEDVAKSSGQENGNDGLKIGAPGYKIGGKVMMAMGSMSVQF